MIVEQHDGLLNVFWYLDFCTLLCTFCWWNQSSLRVYERKYDKLASLWVSVKPSHRGIMVFFGCEAVFGSTVEVEKIDEGYIVWCFNGPVTSQSLTKTWFLVDVQFYYTIWDFKKGDNLRKEVGRETKISFVFYLAK